MKKIVRLLFPLLLILFTGSAGFSQKTEWPNTLLWKISGRGLKEPSFLFGTMHLQDKRVFNLSDSFYHFFEKAEGFAIEIDFKEYMDSVLTKAFQTLEEQELNNDEEEFDKEGAAKDSAIAVADSLKENPPSAEVTKSMKKYFRKLRNERLKKLLIYGQMPTILDAYIYGMAIKQGKWLGAVEEVKDQLYLRDELGKDIEFDEIKLPESKMMFSLENMIKIYLDQDMNKMEEYINNYGTARAKTIMFNNRNLKMSESIDSLSHLRTMFYAVGAAHLPGDSGVIKLLRDRGYTVTPVISKNKIAAEKYAEKLPALSWYEVGQADGLYSIDMPGIPSEYNLFGELLKMKVFVDITTMTFYMTGHTIAQYSDEKLMDALKKMAGSMSKGGKLENNRKVDRNGLRGVEGFVNSPTVSFRIQLLKKNNAVFFLMLGGEKGVTLNTADANKFFYSFKAGNTQTDTKHNNWKEFMLENKAVSVMMPALPKRNKGFEKQAEGSGWNFSVFDCTDLSAGLYYVFQVRDINAGHFLNGDSAFFESFKENLLSDKVKKLRAETNYYSGYPSLRFDAEAEKEALFYKTMNVIRGNRVYTLMVFGNKSKMDDPGPDHFFNSLVLRPYKPVETVLQFADDNTFSSWVPAKFERVKSDEDEDSTRVHYTSYNPNEAISYEVIKDQLPAFYWTDTDTGFYRMKANQAKEYDDSMLSYSMVKNGNITGVEQIIQSPGSSNLKRMRYLLHGDTLYTLMVFAPPQNINDGKHADFFNKFSIRNDKLQPTIFNSKTGKLMEELLTRDSARFANAASLLSVVEFKKEDLPLLHKALLEKYLDDTINYGSVRNKLIDIFEELADSTTVDFIKANYHTLNDRGSDQVALLNILAEYKTVYSYNALKELFINSTPKNLGNRVSFGYGITDSLLLTKILFPQALTLLKNTDFWQDITDYTATLIDSNILQPDIIKPYAATILFTADTLLKGNTLKEEDIWSWPYKDLVFLLGSLNSTESNSVLQRFVLLQDLFLKKAAMVQLLNNNQNADAKEIEKIAASSDYRIEFYEELKKIKKESFFTAKYRTQRYFAEAAIYGYGDEDYTPSSVEFVEEREVFFDGEKKRFFLFRLGFKNDEEKEQESYLGIAGPYTLDPQYLETNNDATEIFYEEEFSKKSIDRQFKELIKKGEEYNRNREK